MRGSVGAVWPVTTTGDIREERRLGSTSTADCPSSFIDSPETTLVSPLND